MEHDRLIMHSMSQSVDFLSAVMDVRGQGHLFSSGLQFRVWCELIVGEVRDVVKKEDVLEGDGIQSHRTTVFEVKGIALHCLRAPAIYHKDTGMKRVGHMSLTQCAIHILLKFLPDGEMLGHVDEMGVRYAASAQPRFTNIVSNLPRFMLTKLFMPMF